jgi:hypothetical protein
LAGRSLENLSDLLAGPIFAFDVHDAAPQDKPN